MKQKKGHALQLISLTCFCMLFYLLVIPFSLYAQNVENLRIEKVQEDGLSNDNINCISQDNDGFIWIGTHEGLFRYDGYSFKAFRNFPGNEIGRAVV